VALHMASLYLSFFCQLSTETKQMHNSTRENNKKKCPTDLLRELETDIDRKRHDLELAEFSMKVSKTYNLLFGCLLILSICFEDLGITSTWVISAQIPKSRAFTFGFLLLLSWHVRKSLINMGREDRPLRSNVQLWIVHHQHQISLKETTHQLSSLT
jgi:hypothetical protein